MAARPANQAQRSRATTSAALTKRDVTAKPRPRIKSRVCTAKTKGGARCTVSVVGGSNRCAFHTPEIVGPARSKGGRAGANYIGEPTVAPVTPAEVQRL